MNSPCSKLQGITSASLCIADKAEYNFTLNPSRAASSGEFKFKVAHSKNTLLKTVKLAKAHSLRQQMHITDPYPGKTGFPGCLKAFFGLHPGCFWQIRHQEMWVKS